MKLKLLVTDLDGTLLNSKSQVSAKNIKSLEHAGKNGIIRVLATGRSFYSLQKSSLHLLPFDYFVFSCGAGIWSLHQKQLIYKCNLSVIESQKAFYALENLNVDFSVQFAVPDNHFYYFVKKSSDNPDFDRRNIIYKNYCHEIKSTNFKKSVFCQMIAVVPSIVGVSVYNQVKKELKELNVVRSTSPLDHQSVWVEVFNKNASKLNGIKQIAKKYHISRNDIMCCGNDFNDEEMLDWCKYSFVVDNAPEELKARFKTVASNNKNGFSEAYELWLKC